MLIHATLSSTWFNLFQRQFNENKFHRQRIIMFARVNLPDMSNYFILLHERVFPNDHIF
jgi:hypothetical protein